MKNVLPVVIVFLFFSCNRERKNTAIQKPVANTFLEKVEPPNWCVGFNNTNLQLLIKEDRITNYQVKIDYSGVTLKNVHKADSPNYLFLDLVVDNNTQPGKFDIVFTQDTIVKKHTYELKQRDFNGEDIVGFNSSDAIYLITPDRFANGDHSNDIIDDLKENKIDRTHNYKRRGGDIRGIINHLDYIENLGFTGIWPTPLLINDMPESSYHGYAITDYYQVDPRFGSLDEYKELSSELRKRDKLELKEKGSLILTSKIDS